MGLSLVIFQFINVHKDWRIIVKRIMMKFKSRFKFEMQK